MRTIDSINGEIGQLEHQIKKHKQRIHELESERAEVELTAKGFRIGQVIELPWGRQTRKGRITGFCCDVYSVLKYKPIKKNGEDGEEYLCHFYDIDKIKILEDAPCV